MLKAKLRWEKVIKAEDFDSNIDFLHDPSHQSWLTS